MDLYCPDGFDLDPTYSTGNFYKHGIPQPKYKFDLFPQKKRRQIVCANVMHLPLKRESINSIIYNPPFLIGHRKNGKPGIIKERFSSFMNIKALLSMYKKSLDEIYRILKRNGYLIFKCQDTINAGKQELNHVKIINYATAAGFYTKDLFILLARNRIIRQTRQLHARKYHSYFIVFQKPNN